MKPTLVILAAGMGSRYGGLKQLDEIGPNGEAIIDYSLFDAIRAGFGKVVFIIRKDFEVAFKAQFDEKLKGKIEVEYAYQELTDVPTGFSIPEERAKPWGTAHAILAARNIVKEPFASINADDFYGKEAYETAYNFLTSGIDEQKCCMIGYQLDKTLSEYGTVSRGLCNTDENENLVDVTELTKIGKEGDSIVYLEEDKKTELQGSETVSMNFWGFHPSIMDSMWKAFEDFLKKEGSALKSEFYIPTHVDNLIQSNSIETKVLTTTADWFGVTYKDDKPFVLEKIETLIKQGKYPKELW